MRRIWTLITVITLLALLCSPALVWAQAAPEATPEVEPAAAVEPADVVRDTGAALTELIAAFLGGAIVSGASVLVTLKSLVKTVDQNPVLMAAIERLYLSLPADTRAPLREGVTTLKEGVDLVDRLTDGITPSLAGVEEDGHG